MDVEHTGVNDLDRRYGSEQQAKIPRYITLQPSIDSFKFCDFGRLMDRKYGSIDMDLHNFIYFP